MGEKSGNPLQCHQRNLQTRLWYAEDAFCQHYCSPYKFCVRQLFSIVLNQ